LLLLSLLASGGGLVVYLVLWIAVREEDEAGADAQGDRFNPAL
jgi:phage shock protein PspC (stress-responsive transcriptional regulator)